MAQMQDELESDWVFAVFEVLREEVVAIAADFGDRVKQQIDQVAATHDVRPPSAAGLLTSVAIESANIAASLLERAAQGEDDGDDGDGHDDDKDD